MQIRVETLVSRVSELQITQRETMTVLRLQMDDLRHEMQMLGQGLISSPAISQYRRQHPLAPITIRSRGQAVSDSQLYQASEHLPPCVRVSHVGFRGIDPSTPCGGVLHAARQASAAHAVSQAVATHAVSHAAAAHAVSHAAATHAVSHAATTQSYNHVAATPTHTHAAATPAYTYAGATQALPQAAAAQTYAQAEEPAGGIALEAGEARRGKGTEAGGVRYLRHSDDGVGKSGWLKIMDAVRSSCSEGSLPAINSARSSRQSDGKDKSVLVPRRGPGGAARVRLPVIGERVTRVYDNPPIVVNAVSAAMVGKPESWRF